MKMLWKRIFSRSAGPSRSKVVREHSGYSGAETQFKGVSDDSQKTSILTIGLDFGTIFTKCVVGDEGRDVKFAVPLKAAPGLKIKNPYLLPSMFWINSHGDCSLDSCEGCQVDNMKMRLLSDDIDYQLFADMCIFIALVFRRVRRYILQEKEAIYGDREIQWMVNIGVPTESYHDKKLTNFYKEAADRSWEISQYKGPINMDKVKLLLAGSGVSENKKFMKYDDIEVFPEFVAQLTGYVRSELRRQGMHLLIDVGGGTLDVTVFNVWRNDGEDRFPIFAKSVKPYGARFLVKHRIKNTDLQERNELDILSNIPKKQIFARLLGMDVNDMDSLDMELETKILEQITDLLDYTKRHRYPGALEWQSGIPLLLCGGGARCDFYQENLREIDSLCSYRIQHRDIPRPENLEGDDLPIDGYDRMSVAYGLSFGADNIGEIRKMNEVEDVPIEQSVCPVCRGTRGNYDGQGCWRCDGTGWI